MSRDRIDWDNLPSLPRKKRYGADRETLAEIKFTRGKAKHKGRCHISNAKRRQIAAEKAAHGVRRAEVTKARFAKYIDAVRAYWKGDADEHPEK